MCYKGYTLRVIKGAPYVLQRVHHMCYKEYILCYKAYTLHFCIAACKVFGVSSMR